MSKSYGVTLAAAALLAFMPAPGQAADQNLSVRNDTGHLIGCRIRHSGSSAESDLTLKAGQVWTMAYSGSKPEMIRCEGELSNWQPIEPTRTYALVRANADRIVVEPVNR